MSYTQKDSDVLKHMHILLLHHNQLETETETEARKNILFGTLSSGINSKRKKMEWECVVEALSTVG